MADGDGFVVVVAIGIGFLVGVAVGEAVGVSGGGAVSGGLDGEVFVVVVDVGLVGGFTVTADVFSFKVIGMRKKFCKAADVWGTAVGEGSFCLVGGVIDDNVLDNVWALSAVRDMSEGEVCGGVSIVVVGDGSEAGVEDLGVVFVEDDVGDLYNGEKHCFEENLFVVGVVGRGADGDAGVLITRDEFLLKDVGDGAIGDEGGGVREQGRRGVV